MSRPVLIIFARVPQLGRVKRRLARDIGARAALRFYRGNVTALLRRLRALRGVARAVSVTPDHHWRLHAPGFTTIRQGRGDLGRRMDQAFRRHPRRRVVLIGSDIPGVAPGDIRTALRALRGADAIFGPTFDGGYWLIGMAGRRPATPFAGVGWSSPRALADTMANFRRRRTVFLRRLRDIDDGADLARLHAGT